MLPSCPPATRYSPAAEIATEVSAPYVAYSQALALFNKTDEPPAFLRQRVPSARAKRGAAYLFVSSRVRARGSKHWTATAPRATIDQPRGRWRRRGAGRGSSGGPV